jgi:hypothetical protein
VWGVGLLIALAKAKIRVLPLRLWIRCGLIIWDEIWMVGFDGDQYFAWGANNEMIFVNQQG